MLGNIYDIQTNIILFYILYCLLKTKIIENYTSDMSVTIYYKSLKIENVKKDFKIMLFYTYNVFLGEEAS